MRAVGNRRLLLTSIAVIGLGWGCKQPPPASSDDVLYDLGRWDSADSDTRRAAAADVAHRLPALTLLRLETFSCGGQTHEVAIYSHAATGLEFVLVPGGSFAMGSPPDEPDRNAGNETQHRVTLSPYLIARTEMTQAAWKQLAGRWDFEMELDETERDARRPVVGVTWDEVAAVLRRVDLALPTEAQWEYACRAGSTTAYFTGSSSVTLIGFANLGNTQRDDSWSAYPSDPDNSLYSKFPDGFDVAAPVASFRPNAFGLYDMAGNVDEWCADGVANLLEPGPPEAVRFEDYPPGPAHDPLRAPTDAGQILRGGSWRSDASWQARSAARRDRPPNTIESTIGFRPARQVPRK